ncbi:hypothetical protein BC332_15430 [Capsicum chinense]|nr:hypothetical protein BC332_15430 [Capsicum chinense]
MIINIESQRLSGASSGISGASEGSDVTTLMNNRISHHKYKNRLHNRYNGESSSNSSSYNSVDSSHNTGSGSEGFNNEFRPRHVYEQRTAYGRSHLYYDFCHFKGHTNDT